MKDIILAMHIPVVTMLFVLFGRAGRSIEARSMRAVSAAWLINLTALVIQMTHLGLSKPLWLQTCLGILGGTSSLLLIIAYRNAGGRYAKAASPGFLLTIGGAFVLVDLLFPMLGLAKASGTIHVIIDTIVGCAISLLIGHSYSTVLLKSVPEAGLVQLLPKGFYVFGLCQPLALTSLSASGSIREIGIVAGLSVALLAKMCMMIGLVDVLGALAGIGQIEHLKAEESRIKVEESKRIIAQLYHELGTPLAEVTLRVAAIINDRRVGGQTRVNASLLDNAKERIVAIMEASADTSLMLFGLEFASSRGNLGVLSADAFPREAPRVVYANSLLEIAKMAVKDTRTQSDRLSDASLKNPRDFQHVDFVLRYAGRLCFEVVPSELVQVLINVISNAYDSLGGRKGTIVITSEQDVDKVDAEARPIVRITIRDSGEGISDENLQRIYEDGFTTRQGPGRGHGLAITKRLVEMNGGTILHRSSADDRSSSTGTIVTLSFPKVSCRTKNSYLE